MFCSCEQCAEIDELYFGTSVLYCLIQPADRYSKRLTCFIYLTLGYLSTPRLWGVGIQFPARTNNFSLLYSVNTGSAANSESYSMDTEVVFTRLRRHWCEAAYLYDTSWRLEARQYYLYLLINHNPCWAGSPNVDISLYLNSVMYSSSVTGSP